MNNKQINNIKIPKTYEEYSKDEIIAMCNLAITEHNDGTTIPSIDVETSIKTKMNISKA